MDFGYDLAALSLYLAVGGVKGVGEAGMGIFVMGVGIEVGVDSGVASG